MEQLKQQLGCGSQCGSCVPEIKRLLAACVQPVVALE
jgi:assimilatory nitrate reductase catalytic subunit